MNWNKKTSADPQTAERQRIDFTKLAQDIEREDTPRVSEFAPLRERIDHSGRLSMQETAEGCQTILTEMQEAVKRMDLEHQRLHRQAEDAYNKIHTAAKQVNEAIVRHADAMAHMVEVLEQLDGKPQLSPPPSKKTKTLPAPIPENEDATK